MGAHSSPGNLGDLSSSLNSSPGVVALVSASSSSEDRSGVAAEEEVEVESEVERFLKLGGKTSAPPNSEKSCRGSLAVILYRCKEWWVAAQKAS